MFFSVRLVDGAEEGKQAVWYVEAYGGQAEGSLEAEPFGQRPLVCRGSQGPPRPAGCGDPTVHTQRDQTLPTGPRQVTRAPDDSQSKGGVWMPCPKTRRKLQNSTFLTIHFS